MKRTFLLLVLAGLSGCGRPPQTAPPPPVAPDLKEAEAGRPAPIFTYPLHADGGLIYDPLRREAEKTGQLARYKDAPTVERVVRSGEVEARFQVPVGAQAYDTMPVSYVLKNTSASDSGPVHVSATAFEDPARRAGRDLYAENRARRRR